MESKRQHPKWILIYALIVHAHVHEDAPLVGELLVLFELVVQLDGGNGTAFV